VTRLVCPDLPLRGPARVLSGDAIIDQMSNSVTLRVERDGTDAVTTVTISTGLGETIVFNEGTYYPRLGTVASRERDEYVVVRTENLPVLASRLGVDGAGIDDMFAAVVESARIGEVDGLAAARRMLDRLEVPYDDETWISYD
jgi:hypothetical protein